MLRPEGDLQVKDLCAAAVDLRDRRTWHEGVRLDHAEGSIQEEVRLRGSGGLRAGEDQRLYGRRLDRAPRKVGRRAAARTTHRCDT